jgi:hypothetical protein
MELLTRQFNPATKCGGFALGTEDAAFSYLAMSASSDTPDQDPRWFAPLLYAGICLAVAAAVLGNLIFTAI